MNIPNEDLDAWRARVHEAGQYALSVAGLVARGDGQRATANAEHVAEVLRRLGVDLDRAGAERPKDMPARLEVPLNLLSTEKSRAYADTITLAYQCARDVDHERGYGDDGPAWALKAFVEAAQLDAYGAVGKIRE